MAGPTDLTLAPDRYKLPLRWGRQPDGVGHAPRQVAVEWGRRGARGQSPVGVSADPRWCSGSSTQPAIGVAIATVIFRLQPHGISARVWGSADIDL